METPEQTVMERLEHGSAPPPDAEVPAAHTFEVKNVSIWYGEKLAIDNVTLDVAANAVTAIIGPSGCGKSTFLRALNRMHELTPKTRMEGTVLLNGEDLYSSTVDPAIVRRRVDFSEIESLPNDDYWRKRRDWLAIEWYPQSEISQRTAGEIAADGCFVGRSEG